jgi:hypothetical protein
MKPSRPDNAASTPQPSGRPEPSNKLIYYPLLGLGLVFLVVWFYLMRQVNFMEWLAQFGPETHTGSFNMLAIMLWMVPALLLWKYYLRWLNRRFEIGGQHDQERHDAMYQDDEPDDSVSATEQPQQQPHQQQTPPKSASSQPDDGKDHR